MQARVRTVLGKQVAQLRRDGLVPGVVYGPLMEQTVEVAVDRRDFERFYVRNGHATLFTLEWDGGSSPVYIRNVQQDPVKRLALHVDHACLAAGRAADRADLSQRRLDRI